MRSNPLYTHDFLYVVPRVSVSRRTPQCRVRHFAPIHDMKKALQFFSIVLLAVCDVNHCYSLLALGEYGSKNDSGVLAQSLMGRKLSENPLNFSQSRETSPGISLPYILIGDEIFPLRTWCMRQYAGPFLDQQLKIYNYIQSRVRRVIKNAFGIARW